MRSKLAIGAAVVGLVVTAGPAGAFVPADSPIWGRRITVQYVDVVVPASGRPRAQRGTLTILFTSGREVLVTGQMAQGRGNFGSRFRPTQATRYQTPFRFGRERWAAVTEVTRAQFTGPTVGFAFRFFAAPLDAGSDDAQVIDLEIDVARGSCRAVTAVTEHNDILADRVRALGAAAGIRESCSISAR